MNFDTIEIFIITYITIPTPPYGDKRKVLRILKTKYVYVS